MDTQAVVELINPTTLMAPRGFAHATLVRTNKVLYLAGQVAADKAGIIQHRHDLVRQFDMALQNLRVCVEAVGGRMDQIVKLNYYVLNVQDYLAKLKALGAVYREYCGHHFPAMTLVEVSGLYNDGALIEIDGVAALDPEP